MVSQRVRYNLVIEQQQLFFLGLSSYETLWTSCSESIFSVFHSSMKFLWYNFTVLQNQTLYCLLFPLHNPQPRKLDMGFRQFTLGELLCYNYFPVCELLTYCAWDLIYHSWTHPPTISFLAYFYLDIGIFFF